MKAKLLFLFSIIFLANVSNAQQWYYYKELPVNIIPKAAAITNTGTLYMLTTDNKVYYKTTAGLWTNITPAGLVSSESIAADPTSGRIYVGSTRQGLFFSSNNGASWQITSLETNPVTGFREGYSCFAQTNDPNLFFVGHFGSPRITVFTNQGASGQIRSISSNPNATPTVLHYTSNQKLLAGTHSGIWFSENNGVSFVQSGLSTGHVFSLTENGNGRVYALRRDLNTQQIALLYSDNYNEWTAMDVPQVGERYTTVFYDRVSDNLWLGSETGIYIRYSGTNVWERKNLNVASLSVIQIVKGNNTGIHSFSPQHIAMKLDDNITNWSSLNDGLKGLVSEIVFAENNRLFAYHNFFSNKISALAPQSDNWDEYSIPNSVTGISNVIPQGNNKVFTNTFNKMFMSQDMGNTYSEIPVPEEFAMQTSGSISMFKKGQGNSLLASHSFISQKIYGSTDNGMTWNTVSNISSISIFGSIFDFSQDSNRRLYLIRSAGNFQVYTSADGNSWQLIPYNYSDISFSFSSCYLTSIGQRTFLVGRTKLFEIVSSGGNYSIQQINTPFLDSDNTVTNFKLTANGQFIVNTYNDGVYISDTNGNTWNALGFPSGVFIDNSQLNAVPVYDNIPFIVINEGNRFGITAGIYYYIKSELSTNEEKFSSGLVIYPNPVRNELYLQSEEILSFAQITDCSGRIIMSVREVNGKIDVSGLSEGLYFLQAQNQSGKNYTIKFIKN